MLNRSYLQQIALIQSQCQPRKKQSMINTYSKSPLRDRQNKMNIGNTPNRIGPKASLSPLRSRRTQSNIVNRSNFNRKRSEPNCINDPHKAAKYLTYSQEQTLYYCQKCAILLASQGFSVAKIANSQASYETNPRKQQIDTFLSDIEMVMSNLGRKQMMINTSIESAFAVYQAEQIKVEEYYGHFFEIIEQHKRRVLQQLKEDYTFSVKQTNEGKAKLQNAITDSKRMKDDIIESMNIILYESDETQFRPIMDNYHNNLHEYKELINKVKNQPINVRKLHFKDPEAACNALQEGLQIQWEPKDNMEYSKQSDCPENPVQIIENQETFTKSSLRQIGNLFSSFDQ